MPKKIKQYELKEVGFSYRLIAKSWHTGHIRCWQTTSSQLSVWLIPTMSSIEKAVLMTHGHFC